MLADVAREATPFDPMDHLNTAKDVAELMRDALATGDEAVIQNVADMIAGRGEAGIARVSPTDRGT